MFEMKKQYNFELQTPETMKLFGSTKQLQDKTKNNKNIPSLEVFKVVLVQWNLFDHQYQQKPKVLYTFTPNKYYLLNIEPSNLVFRRHEY